MAAKWDQSSAKRHLRALLTAPHLAAFLPAVMFGAYWYGGENLMLLIAILFPGLLALAGSLTRTPPVDARASDAITGLPMKGKLLEYLDRGFTSDAEFEKSCLLLEVDDLSDLAQQMGHAARDLVLETLADRIRSALRRDDLVCFLGDGTFGIAIDKDQRADLEATLQLAGRLQTAVSDPIMVDNARVHLSACIGFVLPSRAPEATGEALFAAAQGALIAAQAAGPGSIRAFSNGMPGRSARSDHTNADLVQALDSGQIRPWFQPQISTDTGQLTGVEALARWQHPSLGLIAPGAFLPALAKAGLLERLGEVMLFGALKALQDWDKRELGVPSVALNLSTDELNNPKLFEKIRWELDRFEMPANRLTCEILENVIADGDDEVVTHNIASLRRLGCNIDLDDFGTGHASIANIRRFDINRIKIDRSFVTHVDTDRDQQSMVAAVLTMAEQLGVGTVAEGVESHGEHAILAQLGCDHVQGFSIAKPMPAESLASWIESHQTQTPAISSLPRRA